MTIKKKMSRKAPKKDNITKKRQPAGELLVGRHINTKFGIESAPWFAQTCGARSYQLFTGSSRGYVRRPKSPDLLKNLRDENKRRDVQMVIHSSLLINLCREPDSDIWTRSVNSLVADLAVAAATDAIGVVVHMGCSVGQDWFVALENYVAGIRRVLELAPAGRILLETSSGEGTEMCSMVCELSLLWDLFAAGERARMGFCVDTCHIFAAGYDIRTYEAADKYLALWDSMIGIEHILCYHINDSKQGCGSHRDRHADIGCGHIWGDENGTGEMGGLRRFIHDGFTRKVPLILETPSKQMSVHFQLAAMRTLLLNSKVKHVKVSVDGPVRAPQKDPSKLTKS
jgi:deoxyribonuclease-4